MQGIEITIKATKQRINEECAKRWQSGHRWKSLARMVGI
jgi:hypothetical protein